MRNLMKRLFSITAGLFIVFSLMTFPVRTVAAGAVSLYDEGTKKSNITLSQGQEMQIQFKANAAFVKVGVYIGFNSEKKELYGAVYKWDSNTRTSEKAEPVLKTVINDWNRNDTVYVDFSSQGACPAGEYLFVIGVTEGNSLRFNWYESPVEYAQGYIDGLIQKGCPMSEIVFANGEGKEALGKISPAADSAVEVPPEYIIPADHPINTLNVDSTLWTFVDGLGRPAVEYNEAGNKNNKKVGIFFWTWHYNFASNRAINVQKIVEEYPEAANDYNHEIWKTNTAGAYFWNEPIWGFYAVDRYVLRKQAELLADAGVDFVLFDCTNGDHTWEKAYVELLDVWEQARQDGVRTPQIGFMLPFGDEESTVSSLKQIYKKIYMNGKYQDLWFYLDGKPFVMAMNHCLNLEDAFEKQIYDFFTFRRGEPGYFGDDHDNTWFGWLHRYPQALYKRADGSVESTTVGVAMNADYKTMRLSAMNGKHNMGRGYSNQRNFSYSYTYRGETIVCNSKMENAYYYGINFQEQWDYALEVDPDIVFVTGWNEWIAGRNDVWQGVENGFPDQYNDENSRDIEPSKGDLKDYYYYQLVNNVRKYKGMSAPVSQNVSKTVTIGDFSSFDDPNLISYNHYAHNTIERDNVKGWGTIRFNSPAIRNDFVEAKAVNDSEYIYFYVRTDKDITHYTDDNWMRLLIDTGAAAKDSKDWEEFEYIVGRLPGTADTLTLERSKGGWDWEKAGDVSYAVSGNMMMLAVRKADLGISGNDFQIGFKWADNNITDGDVLTLYTDGDTAPGGRFAFVFNGSDKVVDTPIPEDTPSGGNSGDNSGSGKGCGGILMSSAVLLILILCLTAFCCKSKIKNS